MADESLIPINDINAQAFNTLFDRLGTLDLTPLLIYLVDEVKPSALPHLAEQFHILGNEGWLFASSETEQRELIKKAVQIHRYKGTKFSLEKVLEALNLNGKVKEWFQYSGQPYYFKVILDLQNRSFDSTAEKQLIDLLEETKNVRSILEKLEVNLTSSAEQAIQSVVISSEEVVI